MAKKNVIIKICDYVMEISWLAVIFFIPTYFAFFQENYNIFELNKLVIFRIFLVIMLLAFVGKIFINREAAREIKSSVKSLMVLLFLIITLAIAFFISTYFSIHPQLSLWGSYSRQQGFYSLINYLLFFILLILNLRSWPQIRRIIITIMFSSFLVCLYGLLQYFTLDPLDWKEKALLTGRIFSSLGQPNFLGQYLIMVIPISFFSLIFITRQLFSRFLVFILILIELFCLLFTYSRAAWLGLLVSLSIFIILFLFIKKYKKIAWSLIVIGLAGIIFLISFNIIIPRNSILLQPGEITFVNRLQSVFNLESGSNRIRLYYWQAGLDEFRGASWSRKIFGYGPETLSSIFIKYYRSDWGIYETINTWPDRTHNAIFDIILQFGIFGLLAFILLYVYIITIAIRYLRKLPKSREYWLVVVLLIILVGYFINNLFSFSLTVGHIYLYIMLAMLVVLTIIFPFNFSSSTSTRRNFLYEKEDGSRGFLSSFSRWLIWLVLFIVCGIFIYFYNIKLIWADYYYMKVKRAERGGNCRMVIDNMEKVLDLYPISNFYKERYIYHNLNCFGFIESKESQINLYQNITSVANSIGPHEYQSSTWVHIAHAKSLFGYYLGSTYYGTAEEDYNQLIKFNPYITFAYKDLGKMKLWQGDYDTAIYNLRKAIEVAPSLDSPYLNNDHRQKIEQELIQSYEMLGVVYSNKKDWEKSLDYYQKALKLNPHYLRLYKKVADVYYQQGDLDKAIWYNKRGMMLNKEDYSWPFALALLYRQQAKREEAEEYAKKALELNPENEAIIELLNEIK